MRWLVAVLLLANVLFFGWQYNQQRMQALREVTKVAPLPANTPSLRLLSEVDELPPPRSDGADIAPKVSAETLPSAPAELAPDAVPAAESPAVTPSEEPPPATTETAPVTEPATHLAAGTAEMAAAGLKPSTASAVCIDAGPFAHAADHKALEAWLRPRATVIHIELQTVNKRQLFWVYLETISNSDAQRSIADLQRKGVRDYLLIQRGGLKNAISLGLFSSQDAVNRRLAEMNDRGYKPVVVPRIETTDLSWVRANLARGNEDTAAIPKDLLGTAQLRQIDCTEIAEPIASQ